MVKILGCASVWILLSAGLSVCLMASDDELFVTADQCMACHNRLVTPSGEEVSIGLSWRPSMMANSARDPYWHGAVRREILDHPQARVAIENKCSTCHMPMAHVHSRTAGKDAEVFAHLPAGQSDEYMDRLAADGTSCAMCHQISDQGLGTEASFTGGFKVDTAAAIGDRQVFGPFEIDEGRQRIMRSASGFLPLQATHLESAEFCASCHTLFTHALGPDGEELGELPEQVPYLEWRHSDYLDSRPCQSCHMQSVEEEMPISSVMGEPRVGFSRHFFRGGNFLMPRIFNLHREELGIVALPQELDSSARRTLEHLATESARITIASATVAGGYLEVSLIAENLAGHKLPTAYPSRRVWVRFSVADASDSTVFESGGFEQDGSIRGNDNDEDPRLFEPHYEKIEDPEQVQIYEVIMVDHQGEVTTGLLTGLKYVKDNRLLPSGFDKETADEDVAVRGTALADKDFRGAGDQIEFRVALGQSKGPYTITAELLYQPIAFRWAQNLGQYDAPEAKRFVSFYESVANSSSALLARAEKTLQ